jgi:hypothetical protein
MRRSLAVLLVGCLLLAACSSTSSDSHKVATGVVTGDIRETVKGLITAALNDDADTFSTYLASSCGNPKNSIAAITALRGLLPKGHVSVELPKVDAQMLDENHVKVTAFSGLKVSVDDKPLPDTVALAITEPELRFVKENGNWRLETCAAVGG